MAGPAQTTQETLASFDLSSIPVEELSLAERLALAPQAEREAVLDALSPTAAEALAFDWSFWGRPDQQEPEVFSKGLVDVWAIRAGRGYGKTRTGAETTRRRAPLVEFSSIIAPTAGDARDILIEGESGILRVCPRWERPHYEPSKRRLTWPNGAVTSVFSADEPDRLRGPQSGFLWGDEPASWRYGEDAWDNAELGLRLGTNPQAILTGTPRPLRWLRAIWDDPKTVVTVGASYRNLGNLAASFIERILRRYEGTRLGLQEVWAMILDDVEGALWTRATIDRGRVTLGAVPDLDRIVVGVDPAVDYGPDTDETGIVVVGREGERERGHAYVLSDFSGHLPPAEWARAAVDAYWAFEADAIIAEKNQGGELVRTNLHAVDPRVKVDLVHAARGKKTRAEPIATLYEGTPSRVHHVGVLAELETEQAEWIPGEGDSPNRVDALVWAVTDLIGWSGKRRVRVR